MRKSKIKNFKKISKIENQKIKNQNFFQKSKIKFLKIPVMNTNTQPKFTIYI